MKKQQKHQTIKCMYCSSEATGIIYRAKNQLENVFSCNYHATNLFIPFKDNTYTKQTYNQSRYRSPIKKNPLTVSFVYQQPLVLPNPQTFFDNLMQNIIDEFNTMKRQVLTNYNLMKNIQKSPKSLNFQMQGNQAYPYMIINNDQDMLMSTFVNGLVGRYQGQVQAKNRQEMLRKRQELKQMMGRESGSRLKSLQAKNTGGTTMETKSVYDTPGNNKILGFTDRSGTQTQKNTVSGRLYSRTQKRPIKQIEQK